MIIETTPGAPGDALRCSLVATGQGNLRIFWHCDGNRCAVTAICLPGDYSPAGPVARDSGGNPPIPLPSSLAALGKEIRRSFEGEAPGDPSLDLLDMTGCSDFQRKVLRGLRSVPRGMTVSYGTLARSIGAPRAARAVGTALARNPFPLAFPCHRVIRSSGEVGHFGGGPSMKESLLRREGVVFTGRGIVSPRCLLVELQGTPCPD